MCNVLLNGKIAVAIPRGTKEFSNEQSRPLVSESLKVGTEQYGQSHRNQFSERDPRACCIVPGGNGLTDELGSSVKWKIVERIASCMFLSLILDKGNYPICTNRQLAFLNDT